MRITCHVRKLAVFLRDIKITVIIPGSVIIFFNHLLLLWSLKSDSNSGQNSNYKNQYRSHKGKSLAIVVASLFCKDCFKMKKNISKQRLRSLDTLILTY